MSKRIAKPAQASAERRWWTCAGLPCATVRYPRSTVSICRCMPAKQWRSSARTAPARRRCCPPWRVSSGLRPEAVEIGGRPAAPIPLPEMVRHGVALVPEGRNIFGSLTVMENLRLGATVRRDDGVAAEIERVVETFPVLGERRNQPAGQLGRRAADAGDRPRHAFQAASPDARRAVASGSLRSSSTAFTSLSARSARKGSRSCWSSSAERAFARGARLHMSHGAFTLTGTPAEIRQSGAFDAAYFGVAMEAVP